MTIFDSWIAFRNVYIYKHKRTEFEERFIEIMFLGSEQPQLDVSHLLHIRKFIEVTDKAEIVFLGILGCYAAPKMCVC